MKNKKTHIVELRAWPSLQPNELFRHCPAGSFDSDVLTIPLDFSLPATPLRVALVPVPDGCCPFSEPYVEGYEHWQSVTLFQLLLLNNLQPLLFRELRIIASATSWTDKYRDSYSPYAYEEEGMFRIEMMWRRIQLFTPYDYRIALMEPMVAPKQMTA